MQAVGETEEVEAYAKLMNPGITFFMLANKFLNLSTEKLLISASDVPPLRELISPALIDAKVDRPGIDELSVAELLTEAPPDPDPPHALRASKKTK